MSTQQYLRKFSVVVGGGRPTQTVTSTDQGTTTQFNDESAGLDFSQFRVTFTIRRGDLQEPNSADIRIYNVADSTANRLTKEFTRVVVQAGYEGNYGLIFDGTIKQARKGRVDGKDSYVEITAADGDEPYNFSLMALTLAAGSTADDSVSEMIKSMASAGVGELYAPELPQNGRLRGRVYYGLTRDELRDFAEVQDCLWSIQNGQLVLIPKTSYMPGDVPVISPSSGLIGVPEQVQNGVNARVLLNPSIKIGQRVRLDSTVNPYRFDLGVQSQAANENTALSNKLSADGMYYVAWADYVGDTRGEEWYSDLTLLAVDATIPADAAPRGAIAPEAASIRRN